MPHKRNKGKAPATSAPPIEDIEQLSWENYDIVPKESEVPRAPDEGCSSSSIQSTTEPRKRKRNVRLSEQLPMEKRRKATSTVQKRKSNNDTSSNNTKRRKILTPSQIELSHYKTIALNNPLMSSFQWQISRGKPISANRKELVDLLKCAKEQGFQFEHAINSFTHNEIDFKNFFYACVITGCEKTIKPLVDKWNEDLSKYTNDFVSYMKLSAIEYNQLDCLKYLDNHMKLPDPDNPEIFSIPPQSLAALQGHINILQYLIHRDGGLALPDSDNRTLLHYAAVVNQREMFEFLLELGLDPLAQDNAGRTVLHYAMGIVDMKAKIILQTHSVTRSVFPMTLAFNNVDFYGQNADKEIVSLIIVRENDLRLYCGDEDEHENTSTLLHSAIESRRHAAFIALYNRIDLYSFPEEDYFKAALKQGVGEIVEALFKEEYSHRLKFGLIRLLRYSYNQKNYNPFISVIRALAKQKIVVSHETIDLFAEIAKLNLYVEKTNKAFSISVLYELVKEIQQYNEACGMEVFSFPINKPQGERQNTVAHILSEFHLQDLQGNDSERNRNIDLMGNFLKEFQANFLCRNLHGECPIQCLYKNSNEKYVEMVLSLMDENGTLLKFLEERPNLLLFSAEIFPEIISTVSIRVLNVLLKYCLQDKALQKALNIHKKNQGGNLFGHLYFSAIIRNHSYEKGLLSHYLAYGPDLFAKNNAGQTMIDLAVNLGNDEDLNLILNHLMTVCPDYVDLQFIRPLIRRGSVGVLKNVFSKIDILSIALPEGNIPLSHEAIQSYSLPMIQFLKNHVDSRKPKNLKRDRVSVNWLSWEASTDIKAIDQEGNTLLHRLVIHILGYENEKDEGFFQGLRESTFTQWSIVSLKRRFQINSSLNNIKKFVELLNLLEFLSNEIDWNKVNNHGLNALQIILYIQQLLFRTAKSYAAGGVISYKENEISFAASNLHGAILPPSALQSLRHLLSESEKAREVLNQYDKKFCLRKKKSPGRIIDILYAYTANSTTLVPHHVDVRYLPWRLASEHETRRTILILMAINAVHGNILTLDVCIHILRFSMRIYYNEIAEMKKLEAGCLLTDNSYMEKWREISAEINTADSSPGDYLKEANKPQPQKSLISQFNIFCVGNARIEKLHENIEIHKENRNYTLCLQNLRSILRIMPNHVTYLCDAFMCLTALLSSRLGESDVEEYLMEACAYLARVAAFLTHNPKAKGQYENLKRMEVMINFSTESGFFVDSATYEVVFTYTFMGYSVAEKLIAARFCLQEHPNCIFVKEHFCKIKDQLPQSSSAIGVEPFRPRR